MRSVSRFESNLLQIVQGVFRPTARRKLLRFIANPSDRPKCLSASAVFLLQDTLAKGSIQRLALQGAWRRDRFLRSGQAKAGRTWDRIPLNQRRLSFSEISIRFLLWLTSTEFSDNRKSRQFHCKEQPTGGDLLLLYWVYEFVREAPFAAGWRNWPVIVANPFCRLMFPEDFGEAIGESCKFESAFTTDTTFLWEVLQPQLAARWIAIEQGKLENDSVNAVQHIGQSQIFTAGEFLNAAERAGRRDLARWFFETTRLFFLGEPTAEQWTGHLQVEGLRMADRVEAYRAAVSLAQIFARLDIWQAEARAIGYLDEDYRAAQFWLEMWEHMHGDALSSTAKRMLRSVDPIS